LIKLLPYPLIYIEEIESWLNQMSLDGYYLKKISKTFAIFKAGEPKDIKYTIITHAYTSDIDKDNILDIYSNVGWELINYNLDIPKRRKENKYIGFAIYKSSNPKESIRPELKDDNIYLEKLSKNPLLSVIISLLLATAWICFLVYQSRTRYLFSGLNGSIVLFFSIALILRFILETKWEIRKIKLYNQITNNEYIKLPLKTSGAIKNIILFLFSICITISPVYMLLDSILFDYLNLYNHSDFQPINLQVITNITQDDLPEYTKENGVEGNYYFNMFFTKKYTIYDFTVLKSYSDSLINYEIDYSKTWIKGLPSLMYKTWAKDDYSHTSINQFPNVSYYIENHSSNYKTIYILMYNDYEIVYVEYSADFGHEDILENIENHYIEVQDD